MAKSKSKEDEGTLNLRFGEGSFEIDLHLDKDTQAVELLNKRWPKSGEVLEIGGRVYGLSSAKKGKHLQSLPVFRGAQSSLPFVATGAVIVRASRSSAVANIARIAESIGFKTERKLGRSALVLSRKDNDILAALRDLNKLSDIEGVVRVAPELVSAKSTRTETSSPDRKKEPSRTRERHYRR